ncbi:MAG: beta-phosphoglucomutase [Dethiobacteria bacterium]
MKQLKSEHPSLYNTDPWKISETNFSLKNNLLSESIFALGNGYIGMRGSFEEGLAGADCRTNNGIYLNGFYESVPIPHAERGYGYAVNTQTMLNVTNSRIIELYLDEERFSMVSGTILKYERTIDMKKGYLFREVLWRSPLGREVRICIKRLVSYTNRHIAAFYYEVEPLNFSGIIKFRTALDGAVDNHTHEENDPRLSASLGGLGLSVSDIRAAGEKAVMLQETKRSELKMACAMLNSLNAVGYNKIDLEQTESAVYLNYLVEGEKNKILALEKYVAYYTTRDFPEDELIVLAESAVNSSSQAGFQSLLKKQEEALNIYWQNLGVEIAGDLTVEQGLHFNLFHLFQAAGGEGKTGIGAKGLTSEGYDGHYFWDAEIYMIPFYSAILPDEARNLLEYRYSILEHARSRARELSHPRGALYPWRTIAGEEGSSYYPAGTAQYHINAAIAYAACKYVEMTGDYDFILEMGAEIIFETARLWEDLGAYISRKGNQFCYHEVTGPDEYTALVNNNCYTNLMAAWHLNFAAETARRLKVEYPHEYKKITVKIDLMEEEPLAWQRAADNMFIPYDEALMIHPQDDSFLDKEIWDFASTPADNYPLLLHYHPLVIYRYQVCKQPDILLAQFLLGDRFSLEQKRRDYKYYEPITTHDSSLSPAIFGVVASELGYNKDAYRFFSITARLDLDNLLKDAHFGVHMANMAGSWLCLAYGFGGMRTQDGKLSFKPILPDSWERFRFRIYFKGSHLEVRVDQNRVSYHLLQGDSISFTHYDVKVNLLSDEKFECSYVKTNPVKYLNTEVDMSKDNLVHSCKRTAIIFDLDGVLTDTAEFHYQAWRRLAEEEGFAFSREDNEKLRGVSRRASLELVLKGRDISEDKKLELMERKNSYYREQIKTISEKDILPGAVALLNILKKKEIRLALASASKNARDVVGKLGIGDYFEVIADGNSVEKTKPAPDLFLFAADKLAVSSRCCVVIEDAEAGISAARAAGMSVVGIGPAARVGDADLVYNSVAEININEILALLQK